MRQVGRHVVGQVGENIERPLVIELVDVVDDQQHRPAVESDGAAKSSQAAERVRAARRRR